MSPQLLLSVLIPDSPNGNQQTLCDFFFFSKCPIVQNYSRSLKFKLIYDLGLVVEVFYAIENGC